MLCSRRDAPLARDGVEGTRGEAIMTRWFSKRWVWAALAGATVSVGFAAAGGAPPQKVGEVISLNFEKGERKFKVLKSEKQPDGSYLTELKDVKSGETLTLLDKPEDAKSAPAASSLPGKAAEMLKDAVKLKDAPKAKRPDPLLPAAAAADEPKERRLLGRIFGDRDRNPSPGTTANAQPRMERMEMPADPQKRAGLMGRFFGRKPSAPGMPSAGLPVPGSPAPTASPPPVIPLPMGGLGKGPAAPLVPGGTTEPPRVMPARPGSNPMPTSPAPKPSTPPLFPPSASMPPSPLPLPVGGGSFAPAPVISRPVAVPTIPAPPGLPAIPVPGGTSMRPPTVVQASYMTPQVAIDRDVRPFVIALQSTSAPSARLTAAKGLAEGRHGSTDGVKSVLFLAAKTDPCGEVRAACIDHLCKLGYFHPQFLGYIQAACEDENPQVRDAAKAACEKMMRK
jgi:hypothetical protein